MTYESDLTRGNFAVVPTSAALWNVEGRLCVPFVPIVPLLTNGFIGTRTTHTEYLTSLIFNSALLP
jgi:hypothetical protein